MRYDERFLDEIKSRLRLSDVIGKTVKLRRQGREFAGLSPFTKEKTPSFFVNDDKGFYHCFSSGKHGDLISFLQETERLSFPEAVERLAAEAGVPMPAVDPQAIEEEKKRQGLGDWLETAAKWFEAELRRPGGAEARAYLEKRGLPEADWARFRLGYSPAGRTALKDYLIAKGAKPGELVDAGLLITPEEGGAAPYDRFRERIIFPITDARGRVVSFGGRALNPEAKAKYLNGPETALFDKGRTLYGLAEARKLLLSAQAGEAPLVVVEGYMDVIACQRAKIAAVAPMGTALTEGQMELLWRNHPEPVLCFDSDAAGRRAAGRVIERALPLLRPGRSFQFAKIEGGKDPDDIIREHGPAELNNQISNTIPLVEELFNQERKASDPLNTPERRVAFKVRLRKMASGIADAELARAYREDLLARYEAISPDSSKVYRMNEAARASEAKRYWDPAKRRWIEPLSGATIRTKTSANYSRWNPHPLAAALAIGAIRHSSAIIKHIERIDAQGFGDKKLSDLAHNIVGILDLHGGLEEGSLKKHLIAAGMDDKNLNHLESLAARSAALFLDPRLPEVRVIELWERAFDAFLSLKALDSAVQLAKSDLERDPDFATLRNLKIERDALVRAIGSGEIWSIAIH